MSKNAIDIYDYDGTLCDNQEYLNRLSISFLDKIIEDVRGSGLSERERDELEFLCIVEYPGFFWEDKASEILKEFDLDYDKLGDDYKSRLNDVRKNIRNQFFGEDNSDFPLGSEQQVIASEVMNDIDAYFKAHYGASPQYKPFDDIGYVLDNPSTIKAIATQREHEVIASNLERFSEIGEAVEGRFSGMGQVHPDNGEAVKPKPSADLIVLQYNKLIKEYDEKGVDIRQLPIRMTGDSVMDVLAMRNAQSIINKNRSADRKVDCCVIGVVREGEFMDDLAYALREAGSEPVDGEKLKSIDVHIVKDFKEHRELTDRLDSSVPLPHASLDM